jgi:putative ABC transport system permease protein
VETPIFNRPLAQDPRQSIQLLVRSAGDVASVTREIQTLISAVEPSIPVNDAELVTVRLAKTLAYPRFRAIVLGCFALTALLLSAVGLHGVVSQLVTQRIPEFGVRRANGAQTSDLLLVIARQGGVPVVAGLTGGVCLTIAFSRVLANLLYGIQPANPNALAIASLLLLAVAGIAILLPAIRAAAVDPMVALRDE